jgi:hypothetical protein
MYICSYVYVYVYVYYKDFGEENQEVEEESICTCVPVTRQYLYLCTSNTRKLRRFSRLLRTDAARKASYTSSLRPHTLVA